MRPISHDTSTENAVEPMLDQTRRDVLQYLVNHENKSISLDELAHVLADDASPPSGIQQDVPERYSIGLHHNHLPKLDEEGFIHYNPNCHEAIYQGDGEDGAGMPE